MRLQKTSQSRTFAHSQPHSEAADKRGQAEHSLLLSELPLGSPLLFYFAMYELRQPATPVRSSEVLRYHLASLSSRCMCACPAQQRRPPAWATLLRYDIVV
ncbi:uncharacterized protein SETTUDRAFT_167763, partial [Exserohilum turcica Et28A]